MQGAAEREDSTAYLGTWLLGCALAVARGGPGRWKSPTELWACVPGVQRVDGTTAVG